MSESKRQREFLKSFGTAIGDNFWKINPKKSVDNHFTALSEMIFAVINLQLAVIDSQFAVIISQFAVINSQVADSNLLWSIYSFLWSFYSLLWSTNSLLWSVYSMLYSIYKTSVCCEMICNHHFPIFVALTLFKTHFKKKWLISLFYSIT